MKKIRCGKVMNIVTHRGRRKTEFSMRDSEGLLREVVAAQEGENQQCVQDVLVLACLSIM